MVGSFGSGGFWEFPKIRGTFLSVPILKTIVFGALHWVPLFWETTIFRFKVSCFREVRGWEGFGGIGS